MPPADGNKQLSADEIELIRAGSPKGPPGTSIGPIGATERKPATAAAAPVAAARSMPLFWPGWPMLDFQPAPPADRATLVRRLYFDLTGLPPSADQVEAFPRDQIARCLRTPGRSAVGFAPLRRADGQYWLDLVRYADSGGYHSDNAREVWLYRDYVIAAFNGNKPFDRFTREQLAGDLLPEPTRRDPAGLGLQPAVANDRGGRRAGEGIHGQVRRRSGAQPGQRLAGFDDGLQRMP